MTFQEIAENEMVRNCIRRADETLAAIDFLEHGFAHAETVSYNSRRILEQLGYPERDLELMQIAGYLHDIGNLVNRQNHAVTGAQMAFCILNSLGMDIDSITKIVQAIGNHDEGNGAPVSAMAAALILADKADLRSNRLRENDPKGRYRSLLAIEEASMEIDVEHACAVFSIRINTDIGSVSEFLEGYTRRMQLCRQAAERLGLKLYPVVNGQIVPDA